MTKISTRKKPTSKKPVVAKKTALIKKQALKKVALANKQKLVLEKKRKIELAKKQAVSKAADVARKAAKRLKDSERKLLAAQHKKDQSAKKKEAALVAKEKAKARTRTDHERKVAREAKEAAHKEATIAREVERHAQAEAKAAAREAALKAKRKPVRPLRPQIIKTTFVDGIQGTKEFDVKFLVFQREALVEGRTKLLGQANRLEDEAHALIQDVEMGDVQFDEEGGEGDTMVVERERDLTLSAQARQTVEEIDAALDRIRTGEYGYSVHSGLPIPRERLKALPWTTESVLERVGGIANR